MIGDLVGLLIAFPFIAALWFGVYYGVKWTQKATKDSK